jgi:hypothetical protein
VPTLLLPAPKPLLLLRPLTPLLLRPLTPLLLRPLRPLLRLKKRSKSLPFGVMTETKEAVFPWEGRLFSLGFVDQSWTQKPLAAKSGPSHQLGFDVP